MLQSKLQAVCLTPKSLSDRLRNQVLEPQKAGWGVCHDDIFAKSRFAGVDGTEFICLMQDYLGLSGPPMRSRG